MINKRAIEDGTITKQLYICPYCGRKSEFENYCRSNCSICGVSICHDCRKLIELHDELFGNDIWLCEKHYNYVYNVLKHIISRKRIQIEEMKEANQ